VTKQTKQRIIEILIEKMTKIESELGYKPTLTTKTPSKPIQKPNLKILK